MITAPKHRHQRGLKTFLMLCLTYLPGLVLLSCDDYDEFTTDRSSLLSFSADTVKFDTLLTTVSSSTKTLLVYNRGDKGVRISKVALEGGAASPFRINVDGQDLTRTEANVATDFEVRRRDSIVVRAEVTLEARNQDDPFAIADALLFTLESGVQQRIPLTVVGQDAYFMKACTITTDTLFTANRPIVVYDSLVVGQSATLTLAAGTQLMFHEGAGLLVHGRLLAQGSLQQPVIMRGDRTDHMFDYLPYDRLPGRWEGVRFSATSHDNDLTYLDLHSGLYGLVCDSSDLSVQKLNLLSCRVHNIGGDGLRLRHCKVSVMNSEISNTMGHCVSLLGGDATFVHCTLAQFYPLSAARGYALYVGNRDEDIYIPLYNGTFINCVMTGYADDVVQGTWVAGQDNEAHYSFVNCFLATEIPADNYGFTDCVYDDPDGELRHEKNFQLMDTHAFVYDFTPVEKSGIRGIAATTYAATLPTDRLGRTRLTDGRADAGCYSFVATEP